MLSRPGRIFFMTERTTDVCHPLKSATNYIIHLILSHEKKIKNWLVLLNSIFYILINLTGEISRLSFFQKIFRREL